MQQSPLCRVLTDRGTEFCGNPEHHDRALCRQRHRIENLFARIKDWRRITTRYDRCGDLFLAAIIIATTVTF